MCSSDLFGQFHRVVAVSGEYPRHSTVANMITIVVVVLFSSIKVRARGPERSLASPG